MPRFFTVPASAHQPQRVVVGEGATVDECQANEAWLASDTVVAVER